MRTFTLDDEDQKKVQTWIREVDLRAIEYQKSQFKDREPDDIYLFCWEEGYPYMGAIGGGISYRFTPTSIGTIVTVEYKIGDFKEELDLTDWDNF